MNRSAAPRLRWLILGLALCVVVPHSAEAAATCGGSLSMAQLLGFKKYFSPEYFRTTKARAGDVDAVVSAAEREALKSGRLAATATLNEVNANGLRTILNDNSADPVPGWFSTIVGAATAGTGPWIGLAADLAGQLANWSGSDGRALLANLAGTVSAGGIVQTYERIVSEPAGSAKPEDLRLKMAFVYKAVVNGVTYQTTLAQCSYEVAIDPLAALPRRTGSSGAAIVDKKITEIDEASASAARDASATPSATSGATNGAPRSAQQCMADFDSGPAGSRLKSLVAANGDNTVMLLRGVIATIDLQIAALSSCGNSADIRNAIAAVRAQKDSAIKTCQQIASQPSSCTVSPWRD